MTLHVTKLLEGEWFNS